MNVLRLLSISSIGCVGRVTIELSHVVGRILTHAGTCSNGSIGQRV